MGDFNLVEAAATAYAAVSQGTDFVDMGELGAKLLNNTSKSMLPPAAEKALGPLNVLLDGYKVTNGIGDLYGGEANGDPERMVKATHDIMDGGSGLVGTFGGSTLGPLAGAFGGGLAFGDFIAPSLMGDINDRNHAHFEEIPEDGIFKPTSDDWLIDTVMNFFTPDPVDPNTYKDYCVDPR